MKWLKYSNRVHFMVWLLPSITLFKLAALKRCVFFINRCWFYKLSVVVCGVQRWLTHSKWLLCWFVFFIHLCQIPIFVLNNIPVSNYCGKWTSLLRSVVLICTLVCLMALFVGSVTCRELHGNGRCCACLNKFPSLSVLGPSLVNLPPIIKAYEDTLLVMLLGGRLSFLATPWFTHENVTVKFKTRRLPPCLGVRQLLGIVSASVIWCAGIVCCYWWRMQHAP